MEPNTPPLLPSPNPSKGIIWWSDDLLQLGLGSEVLVLMLVYAISLYADGNHKLIRCMENSCPWGIDSYTRMIVYLSCSTNNQTTTVYRLFIAAAERFALPSRVRSDFGGENILVARHMIKNRGINRGSFITGSSTHNQRILRLREV